MSLTTKALLQWLPALAAVLVIIHTWNRQYRRNRPLPLPPGPPGHWLSGNALPPLAWRKLYEYTQEYGPLFSIYQNRQPLVVIGTYKAAIDLMERQGSSLACRPRSIAGGEILSDGHSILMMQQSERLNRLRKALHAYIQPRRCDNYAVIQANAALNLILDLKNTPNAFEKHAKRYAASVVITLTYGKETPASYADPVVQGVIKCLNRFTHVVTPGRYSVDCFPILRYVPGYANELKAYCKEEYHLYREQIETVKKQMAAGVAKQSFARYILERQTEVGLNDREATWLCGSLFGAGAETTAAAITVVIMAAACFPEAQRNVRSQLDQVVGSQRLPKFDDIDDLPLITAFVLETYRWRPISAAGFQRRATQDINYEGYCIPKGTAVVANHWAVFRDPSVFPDPELFLPGRWLSDTGQLRTDIKNFNFGFGRRVCPGLHLASRSLFITTASILWAFKITEDPRHRIDQLAFTDSVISQPLPFKVQFNQRFPTVLENLAEAVCLTRA